MFVLRRSRAAIVAALGALACSMTAGCQTEGPSAAKPQPVVTATPAPTTVQAVTPAAPGPSRPADTAVTYACAQTVTVKDIPAGAKSVRLWVWMPDDDAGQHTSLVTIKNPPAHYLIVREPTTGSRYFYAEIANPGATAGVAMDFTIERKAMSVALDPAKAGAMTDAMRAQMADYLKRDEPNMEVNDRIIKLAGDIAGDETNVVKQMRKFYDYVVDNSDHYSKQGAPKSSGAGSASYCIDNKGGGCTDQHALLIALARSRGIPAKLHFGSRLQAKNDGKEIDPGYRCWVEYYVPNYGWVPTDASAGDTSDSMRDYYFSGLDANRVRFAQGRNLEIGAGDGKRVNLIVGAYVEVDGKPHAAVDRKMRHDRVQATAAK